MHVKAVLLGGSLVSFLGEIPSSMVLAGPTGPSFRSDEEPYTGPSPSDPNFRNDSRRLQGRVCEPTRMNEPLNENTRTCLRQCQLNDQNEVVPDFFDWEDYCYATATDENWDKECEQFYCCLFGCAVFDSGAGRGICYDADASNRIDLLNIVQMKNIQKGQRCDAEKCRGFCVRSEFGTCRELQYTRSCKASKLGLYKCDVKCNHARRTRGSLASWSPHGPLLLGSFLLSLRWALWGGNGNGV